MKSVLIVEDDITYGMMLKTWLAKKGFVVNSVSSIARAQKLIETEEPDLILSDLRLPDRDGLDLLRWLGQKELFIPLIIMTGYADCVSKAGGDAEALKSAPKRKTATESVGATPVPAKAERAVAADLKPAAAAWSEYLEGESEAARQLYNYVRLVAPTNMSVLVNGASGTGKEYVAHRIHSLSKRADKPFIAIDCGAIPKELAASEFFGHVKGAFTGALSDKTGAFVAANGGTIFLDEIGNLSYEVQVQLLRALQERIIRPVGSTREISVDVRLVSATNENLEQAIERGAFREDLYHRINEFTLRIPQLKDRREDILLFAKFFLDQANREMDKQVVGFDEKVSRAMLDYHWPGNLRQMKNVVRRATLLAQGKYITLDDMGDLQVVPPQPVSMALRNEETEKQRIVEALKQTGYNKSRAALLLGIDRKTLYNKLKLYGIEC